MQASVFWWEGTRMVGIQNGQRRAFKKLILWTRLWGICSQFSFLLFQNHSLLILSRLSNQVWTWWQEPLHLLHCGETFQSRSTRSSCWGAHLQMVFMNKKAVTCNRHVRVHTCAYICSLPQVYFALQFKCAELPETGRKKKLSNSAENTMCRLWAFSSPPSLSPQWSAYVMKPAQCIPYLWPQGHLCPSAILEKARPGSALQCPSHIDLQAGVQASASSHSALPNPASWPAEPLQRTSLSVRPLRSVELNPIHVILTFCCMSHELWSQSYGVWDVASVL